MYKVGIGQDSHRFDTQNKKKPLILGGVRVSEKSGLKANSDGDVILHSLCNALSSAIGGDSLGTWADEMCLDKGIRDSKKYIDHIFSIVLSKGYKISNISIAVEAKKPRLTMSQVDEIKNSLSKLLKTDIGNIGITFTSGEDLTVFGQGKAIQAITIVSLSRND